MRIISRRMVAGVALLTLAVLGAACSTGDDAGSKTGGTTAAGAGKDPKDIKIAYVGAAQNLNFSTEMMEGAKYAGKEAGVDVNVVAPPAPDGQQEVSLFQQAASTAKDGIAVMTLNPELFTRPAADAIAKGTPVIAVDVPLAADSGVKTLISNDNLATGHMAADAALAQIPPDKKGKVVIGISSPGVPVLEIRAKGMQEQLKAKNPNLQVICCKDSKQAPDENLKAWTNIVAANSDAVLFMDTGDPAAFNLPKIKQETGGKWTSVAFDLNDAGLAALKAGQSAAIIDPQHWLKGYIAVRLLIEKALGKRATIPAGFWDSGAATITKENVDDIIARQKSPEVKAAWYGRLVTEQFANIDSRMKPLA
ncbi:MAG: sugar ABC transporter substrate-binding protein [Nonomuraea sp.]|nr:sugar ABC transporter substrate-binding protein [Nonomuraea sp.]